MVSRVPRHQTSAVDASETVQILAEDSRDLVGEVESDPGELDDALDAVLTEAKARCLLDPEAAKLETWEAFVTSMQLGSALFSAAELGQGNVPCLISHKVRDIPATGPHLYADAANWLTSFYLAVIVRDQSKIMQLARTPVPLLQASGAQHDEFIYEWIKTLQGYFLEQDDVSEHLAAAVRGTDPELQHVVDRQTMLKFLYPPIDLFYRFLRQDAEKFNEELAKALQWHKEYWTASEDQVSSTSGLVALGPLAVACFAYDTGLPVEVESEYLPKHLIERSWIGEFAT